MTHYQFTSEILDAALDTAGELTDGNSDYETLVLQYLNRVYRSLWLGGEEFNIPANPLWWWMRKESPGVIITEPERTGTAAVTNNSATVTLSATVADSLVGWLFVIDGEPDHVARILTHTAGTAAVTLDGVYTGDTDAAASYTVYRVRYDMASDVLEVIAPMRAQKDSQHKIGLMDYSEMRVAWPLNELEEGVPTNFAWVDENTVEFSHTGGTTSTEYIRIEYDYFVKPDDLTDSASEEPLVPLEFRHHMSDAAAMFILSQKDDSRATDVGAMAKAGFSAMWRQHLNIKSRQKSDDFMRMDLDPSRGRVKRPLRTSSGLIIG